MLAGLARLSGKPLREAELSAEGAIDAIAISDGGKTVLWIANLTKEPQRVMLPGGAFNVAVLDESAVDAGATHPYKPMQERCAPVEAAALDLDAYAVAYVELK